MKAKITYNNESARAEIASRGINNVTLDIEVETLKEAEDLTEWLRRLEKGIKPNSEIKEHFSVSSNHVSFVKDTKKTIAAHFAKTLDRVLKSANNENSYIQDEHGQLEKMQPNTELADEILHLKKIMSQLWE